MADLTLSSHSFVVVFLDVTQYHKTCKASDTNKSKTSKRDIHCHDRCIQPFTLPIMEDATTNPPISQIASTMNT